MNHLAGNIWKTKKGNFTIKRQPIIIPVSSMEINKELARVEHEKIEKIRREARERLGLCSQR